MQSDASTCSTRSWPRCTVQAPGTSTCRETNAARARLAGAQGVEAHAVALELGQGLLDRGEVGLLERAVHQAAGGAAQQPAARDEDVRGDRERDDRVEAVPAGERDAGDAHDHADRRPDVGDQVLAVGLEHDRAGATADA